MTISSRIFKLGSNWTIPTWEFYNEIPNHIREVATGKWRRKFGGFARQYDPQRLPL